MTVELEAAELCVVFLLLPRVSDGLIGLASSTHSAFGTLFFIQSLVKVKMSLVLEIPSAPQGTAWSPGKKMGVQKLTQPFFWPVSILPGSAGHGQKLAKRAGRDRAGETKAGQVRLCEAMEREKLD